MDDHVAEACHSLEAAEKLRGNVTRPAEQAEHVAARLRLAETIVRHDVRAHVERYLDGQLQGVLDESLLAQVARDPLGMGQGPQLSDARLDEGELLRYELGIRHRRGSATLPTAPGRVG